MYILKKRVTVKDTNICKCHDFENNGGGEIS